MKLFGFTLGKKEVVQNQPPTQPAFTLPTEAIDDGAVNITSSSHFGTYVDLEGSVRNELELITRYREMANHPELDMAVDEIVNEAISHDDTGKIIHIKLDNLKLSETIKKKIIEEFDNIQKMLNFSNISDDLFRRWYIDGRLFFHIIVDEKNPKNGIVELRYIDPRKIRKVREIKQEKDPKTGAVVIASTAEYYVYNDRGTTTQTYTSNVNTGVKIAPDSILNINSGLMDAKNTFVISYLHSAIKPLNQLRMIEDAVVIYRISRASERRIFYIDVGNLPKGKAEQYMQDIMVKYRNKMVYNQQSGELVDQRKHLSMLEDFFLPRREGCFSLDTKIKLLDGRDVELHDLIIEHNLGKQNWVYSVDPNGHIVPGKISWAGVTRKNAEILEVHLDNGETIIATPDHKFILRNGEKIEAQHLIAGSSLMPFNTKFKAISKKDYQQIQHNDDNTWEHSHRMISRYFDRIQEKTEVIHHVDFNRFNNNPENLLIMDKFEHIRYHRKNAQLTWKYGDYNKHCENLSKSGKNFFQTPEGQNRRKEISENNKTNEKIINGFKKGREIIKQNRQRDREILSKDEYLKKWSPGLTLEMSQKGANRRKEICENDRKNLSKDEWGEKYSKHGKHNINIHLKNTENVSLSTIKDIIVSCVEKNPRVSNKHLLNYIKEIYPRLSIKILCKYLHRNGYNSISEFIVRNVDSKYIVQKRLEKSKINNHKVVKIVRRDDRLDVGTLTIDEHHEYHDYHNFALSSGIFVMNSKGTEITTLPSGQNLSQIEDVVFFRQKLLQALKVPISRLDPQQGGLIGLGRTSEVTRDEVKFSKFIDRLRNKFSQLFDNALSIQLALKGICTREEWETFKDDVYYDYVKDNNFTEMRDADLMRERVNLLTLMEPYIGTFYSKSWIDRNVLRFSEEEIEQMKKEIENDDYTPQNQQNSEQLMQQPAPEDLEDNTQDTEDLTPQLSADVSKYSKSINK